MADEPNQVAAPADGLRADARRNRDRIVAAATDAFAQHGLGVPMSAIARRAEVGVATLFRRFPTKKSLVETVFSQQFRACGRLLDTALEDPDPWRGFCALLESVRRMQVADRGFVEAFVVAGAPELMTGEQVTSAEHGLAVLVDRAQRAGRLRADFSTSDLTLVLLSIGGVTTGPKETADAMSRRLLAYLLESFVSRPTTEQRSLPAPPEVDLRATVDAVGQAWAQRRVR